MMIDELRLISKAVWRTFCGAFRGIAKVCRNMLRWTTQWSSVGKWTTRIFCILLGISVAIVPIGIIIFCAIHGHINHNHPAAPPIISFGIVGWLVVNLGFWCAVCVNYEEEKKK